jgi:hypothetical protein
MSLPTIPRETDDRIACATCKNFRPPLRCEVKKTSAWPEGFKLRCLDFVPTSRAQDQRTGKQRWPNMQRNIELSREEQGKEIGR